MSVLLNGDQWRELAKKSTVSKRCKGLDAVVAAEINRTHAGQLVSFVFADAMVLKVCEDGTSSSLV
jgi:transposase-like protein